MLPAQATVVRGWSIVQCLPQTFFCLKSYSLMVHNSPIFKVIFFKSKSDSNTLYSKFSIIFPLQSEKNPKLPVTASRTIHRVPSSPPSHHSMLFLLFLDSNCSFPHLLFFFLDVHKSVSFRSQLKCHLCKEAFLVNSCSSGTHPSIPLYCFFITELAEKESENLEIGPSRLSRPRKQK